MTSAPRFCEYIEALRELAGSCEPSDARSRALLQLARFDAATELNPARAAELDAVRDAENALTTAIGYTESAIMFGNLPASAVNTARDDRRSFDSARDALRAVMQNGEQR